jgi:hypothetical protein
MPQTLLLALLVSLAADPPTDTTTQPPKANARQAAEFKAPKFGLATEIPAGWSIVAREQEDRVFVALIEQADPDRPGVAACELGLAPESLDEYRTRIDGNSRRGGRPGGNLTRNQVVKDERGERLETLWEFQPRGGGLWLEFSVRILAHRQMYTFILNVDEATYREARPLFDKLVFGARFSPPNTGADLLLKPTNSWIQREYRFAVDLPEGWSPVLAPSEVALLFANGPAHGVWSDNVLVLAHPHVETDLHELAKQLPARLKEEEPGCEVVSCQVVPQGEGQALETVVRTRRGPFSMTVIERRFRGARLDYEVKFTVESERYEPLAPALRKTLDSFREIPGATISTPGKSA